MFFVIICSGWTIESFCRSAVRASSRESIQILSLVRFATDSNAGKTCSRSTLSGPSSFILYVVGLWIQLMQTQSLFIHKNLSLQSCFLVEAAIVERKDSFHYPPSHFTRASSSKYHDKRCSLFEFLHILFASRSNTEGADCSAYKDDKNLHFRLGLNRCGVSNARWNSSSDLVVS